MAELTQQTSAADRIFGIEVGSKNGESERVRGSAGVSPLCPQCGSKKLWRDGLRYSLFGDRIQRWLCRNCGLRFSDPVDVQKAWSTFERVERVDTEEVKATETLVINCQICATETAFGGAKNLDHTTETTTVVGDERQTRTDQKGKLVDYLWHLKKQGYSEETVKTRAKLLTQLHRQGTNLFNPEDVKKAIAMRETWGNGHKQIVVHAYNGFAKMLDIKWDPPTYVHDRGLPFIPLEKEIDALISGCSSKIAASLMLLKETGFRIGEAWKLKWTDLDEENGTIKTKAEKHGNPRMFKISPRLIAMLNSLPKKNEYIFANANLAGHRWRFDRQKRRLSEKLQNPRLLQIKFHTLRHWKATMEYHKTKDILHVKQLLGHKRIDSTLVYTQLVTFENDDYHSAVAKTTAEGQKLIESGFEFVCTTPENIMLFRKRK